MSTYNRLNRAIAKPRNRISSAIALLAVFALSACGASGSAQTEQSAKTGKSGRSASSSGRANALGEVKSLHDLLPSDVQSSGVLRVAENLPTPPYWLNESGNKPGGLSYDLAHAAAQLLGVRLKLVQTTEAGLIPTLQAGKADLVWTANIPTPQRLKVVNFVLYVTSPWGMLLPAGNPKHINSVTDLCGHAVAIISGAVPQISLIKSTQKQCSKLGKPSIKEHAYTDQTAQVLAVQSGASDVAIGAGLGLAYEVKKIGNGLKAIESPPGFPQSVPPQGLMILKGKNQLLRAMQRTVQYLMDHSTYKKVLNKYGVGALAITKAKAVKS